MYLASGTSLPNPNISMHNGGSCGPCRAPKVIWIRVTKVPIVDSKTIGTLVWGLWKLCLWGARGSKLFLSLLVQSPIFRHFFSRTFPTGLQHDIHHRSPRQIIIHSEHENSRVGQIASRSDRDRQGHSIRRAAQPAPFTTHFCSSHTCPSSFDQLRPACPSLAGISPVSRSISPGLAPS